MKRKDGRTTNDKQQRNISMVENREEPDIKTLKKKRKEGKKKRFWKGTAKKEGGRCERKRRGGAVCVFDRVFGGWNPNVGEKGK